ncbi:MAG: radical SAM protein [Patescibacteria group bacterium]|nr:B12-binding domain-containing radical SAM protein [Patescibacteria group bacterium]
MKVLFINPPNQNEIISCNPEIIKKERGYDPPLGILYLAGYLEKNSNHQVSVIDAQVEKLSYSQLTQRIEESSPDVVGITAMTFTLIDVIKVIELVKKIDSRIKIILGGPHAHIYPKETLDIPGVDFVVLGEGEKPLLELLENIENPEELKNMKNIAFKDGDQIIVSECQDYNQNLDELPFPAMHLTPYKKYWSILSGDKVITTMFTSRGCPYRCTFCDRPNMGKLFRARSSKNVVDEIEERLKMGIEEIFIYDDTFTVNKQRVIDICDEIIKRNLKFSWDIRARVDTVNQEILEKLKQAGCARIHYGVESGTEKILKVLNKGIHLDQVKEVFSLTKKIGISTFAYFIIGCPTETKEDILQTIKFAKKLDTDFVQITLLTPFPATKIYNDALEQGIIKEDYWLEFAKNPRPDFKTKYWTEELSNQELFKFINYAYKQFYLRPNFILKTLKEITSFNDFVRKAKAGFKIISMK